jgi:hypothetical protein
MGRNYQINAIKNRGVYRDFYPKKTSEKGLNQNALFQY